VSVSVSRLLNFWVTYRRSDLRRARDATADFAMPW
jgi:hypothetical protein